MLKFVVVGPGTEEFSLEVHHGGFFIGQGENRAYIDEKIDGLISVKEILSPLFG